MNKVCCLCVTMMIVRVKMIDCSRNEFKCYNMCCIEVRGNSIAIGMGLFSNLFC